MATVTKLYMKHPDDVSAALVKYSIKTAGPIFEKDRFIGVMTATKVNKRNKRRNKHWKHRYDPKTEFDESTMNSPLIQLDFAMAALEHFKDVVCTPLQVFYASHRNFKTSQ